MKNEREEFITKISAMFNDEKVKSVLSGVFDVEKIYNSSTFDLTVMSITFHMECVKYEKINFLLLFSVILTIMLSVAFVTILSSPLLSVLF